MENSFTNEIYEILNSHFPEKAEKIYNSSYLLQYIDKKTISANKGSKSRSSFANLYAIYVLVEDYLKRDFVGSDDYKNYEGAKYSLLLNRIRELPFGSKLQNHALNHRLNQEFRKFFPIVSIQPILREPKNKRYWINENLLKIEFDNEEINLANPIIEIIDAYIIRKKNALDKFIQTCEQLGDFSNSKTQDVWKFITGLLEPNVDARIFEIVSFAILKYYYHDQIVYFGFEKHDINEYNLNLFKTGRTNANDGGIDFVMKPLGRFFQVTETTDVKKYFLDIDKLQRYPVTFVVKSSERVEVLLKKMEKQAHLHFPVKAIVERYLDCIEEIINIPKLFEFLKISEKAGYLPAILDEIVLQSKVEFNHLGLVEVANAKQSTKEEVIDRKLF